MGQQNISIVKSLWAISLLTQQIQMLEVRKGSWMWAWYKAGAQGEGV